MIAPQSAQAVGAYFVWGRLAPQAAPGPVTRLTTQQPCRQHDADRKNVRLNDGINRRATDAAIATAIRTGLPAMDQCRDAMARVTSLVN
jgi:hypothetical protein